MSITHLNYIKIYVFSLFKRFINFVSNFIENNMISCVNSKSTSFVENGGHVRVGLSISFVLLNSSCGDNYELSNIAKSSQDACIKNKMLYPESSLFYKECPGGNESGPVIASLRWLVENHHRLKLEGVSDLVLDTFHDTKFRDAHEVIRLLEKIQLLGLGLLMFDNNYNIIDLGSMGEVISSDDYLEIMIVSLIRKDCIENVDQDNCVEPEVHCFRLEDDDKPTVFRIPVWLELQSNGRFSIIAKNKRRNLEIINHLTGS